MIHDNIQQQTLRITELESPEWRKANKQNKFTYGKETENSALAVAVLLALLGSLL